MCVCTCDCVKVSWGVYALMYMHVYECICICVCVGEWLCENELTIIQLRSLSASDWTQCEQLLQAPRAMTPVIIVLTLELWTETNLSSLELLW